MRYWVYWISNAAKREERSSLRWSRPFATAAAARTWASAKVREGLATLAAVFEFEDARSPGRLRRHEIYPPSAQKVVSHYLDMVAHAADGEPPNERGA